MLKRVLTLMLTFAALSAFADQKPVKKKKILQFPGASEYYQEKSNEILMKEVMYDHTNYSISKLNITWSAAAIKVGTGNLEVKHDRFGDLASVTLDLVVGIKNVVDDHIKETISIYSLKKGKALRFQMQGASKDSLIIQPLKGFDEEGGYLQIKYLTKSGFKSFKVEVDRDMRTGLFKVYNMNNRRKISKVTINMRGLSVSKLVANNVKIE
jgi:hypothetical protein